MGEVSCPDDRDALAPRPPGEPRNVTVLAARPGEARVDMQVGVKHPVSLAAFCVVVGTVLAIRLSRVCALLFAPPPPSRPGGREGRRSLLRVTCPGPTPGLVIGPGLTLPGPGLMAPGPGACAVLPSVAVLRAAVVMPASSVPVSCVPGPQPGRPATPGRAGALGDPDGRPAQATRPSGTGPSAQATRPPAPARRPRPPGIGLSAQ